HAAAVGDLELGEIQLVEAGRVQQAVVERVDSREKADLVFRELLDEAGHIARVGDQQIGAAGAQAEQVASGQREDVIERQRTDDDLIVDNRRLFQRRLQLGVVLQHVGENVAVEQRRSLGDAGGAAGILQEGDVIGGQLWLVQLHAAAGRERIVEGNRTRD